ncbi:MAG: FIST C-terminal domain-containing protein [Candidatus Omnitrophica bacterium]|nr:FIST C-terminal domain-containing protein [Candidatus Omnitrophota bacterium]
MLTANPAVLGWSGSPSAFAAGQTAARAALKQLGKRRAQCAIVFGSSWFDQAQLLEGVRKVFTSAVLAGGSTAGEITPEGPTSHSCVVLALAENGMMASVGAGTNLEDDPRTAGYEAAQQAVHGLASKARSGMLLFGDGLLTGYAEALWGIQEVLGTSSLVTGGLMGDDLRFHQTYQYAQDRSLSRAIVGLLFGGTCKIGVGVEHGFEPISKPRQITRSRANILYELDGQPASSVYEEYFGQEAMEAMRQEGLTRRLIAYPLGIQMEAPGRFLLRAIRAFSEDGGLVCTGEMPEGGWVQLMIGSKGLALEAASSAARQAIQSLRTVHFVLVLDSVVRRLLLGREAAEEIARIRQIVGPSVPLAGCYTYGEQAPLGTPYPYGRSSVQTGACLVIAVGQP